MHFTFEAEESWVRYTTALSKSSSCKLNQLSTPLRTLYLKVEIPRLHSKLTALSLMWAHKPLNTVSSKPLCCAFAFQKVALQQAFICLHRQRTLLSFGLTFDSNEHLPCATEIYVWINESCLESHIVS